MKSPLLLSLTDRRQNAWNNYFKKEGIFVLLMVSKLNAKLRNKLRNKTKILTAYQQPPVSTHV